MGLSLSQLASEDHRAVQIGSLFASLLGLALPVVLRQLVVRGTTRGPSAALRPTRGAAEGRLAPRTGPTSDDETSQPSSASRESAARDLRTVTDAVTTSRSAGETVGRLGAPSRDIGHIAELITSIAEQADLLARNATAGAVRAGGAGPGPAAVVAREVEELAQQTTRATDQVVAGVQTAAAGAAGTADVRAAMERIDEVISRIDALRATVASAVAEQSATPVEVVRSVTEASSGVQQTTAGTTEELPRTSRELRDAAVGSRR